MALNVLMVCTGNICRSPMAEGLLRHHLPAALQAAVTVSSAGTHGLVGSRAEPFAVQAAAEHGADISDHRARVLDAQILADADLILAMEPFHLEWMAARLPGRSPHARLLGTFDANRRQPQIDDPYGLPQNVYTACAGEIVACLPDLTAHIGAMTAKQKA